eukprot:TRINITY_DN32075_c0_g1_i1.p1 TRINITY_DN32075_c0_g1~~TRINITY_DN32075_c0_g1_i1.p1  ORF type:complete len:474 (+),score=55.12 TRINITY_DN32075_c0_g1_i1:25-1422(+)
MALCSAITVILEVSRLLDGSDASDLLAEDVSYLAENMFSVRLIALPMLMATVVGVPTLRNFLGVHILEILALICCFNAILSIELICLLQLEQSCSAAGAHFTVVAVLLAVHLGLPVRWYVLLPFNLAVNIVVLGMVRVGHGTVYDGMVFLIISSLISYAKRKLEIYERQLSVDGHLLRQHAAVGHLTSGFCDAVAILGPNLEIIESEARLSALLRLPSTERLHGSDFCDLMPCEHDKKRFVKCTHNSRPCEHIAVAGVAGMLNITLRDGQGSDFTVSAHHSCFMSMRRERMYVVGLVEVGERLVHHVGNLAVSCPASSWPAGSHQGSSDASNSSEASVSSADAQMDEIEFTLLDDDDFTMIDYNAAFVDLCGPCEENQSVLDYVSDSSNLVSWIQRLSNAASTVLPNLAFKAPGGGCSTYHANARLQSLQVRWRAGCTFPQVSLTVGARRVRSSTAEEEGSLSMH